MDTDAVNMKTRLKKWQQATQKQLETAKERCDVAYDAGRPLIDDATYDVMVRVLRARFPQSKALRDVGAPTLNVVMRSRVETLPIIVGSLDTCRPNEVAEWMQGVERRGKQERWLVEPKFDGVSMLVRYREGRHNCAWKRGKVHDGVDGEESRGEKVTDASRFVQGVLGTLQHTKLLNVQSEYLVRGEVVIHTSLFKEHYEDKPSSLGRMYKKPRNMVAGLLGRVDPQGVKADLNRCTFVALHLYQRRKDGKWRRPGDAYKEWLYLTLLGFTTALNPTRYGPGHQKLYDRVKAGDEALRPILPVRDVYGSLPGTLCYWESKPGAKDVVDRMNSIAKAVDIQLDGIVVQPVNIAPWQTGAIERRPQYIRAVKLLPEDQPTLDGVVKTVEWSVSKRGLIKPTIVLREPLNFEGADVDRCTGNNAKFIQVNKIAPGARIRLIRSGDVIPRIMYVFREGKWKAIE